jgi:acyl-coenzyme A synthetase/AMP-(fatty) acid ligase
MVEMHPSRKSSPMYLSGDLARYTQDGTIEYVGRKDLLLKVDGGRVDATEVEHCARKALSDNDAIMVDLLGGITASAQPVLVAYVYLHDHPMSEVKYGGETVFKPSTLCPQASRRVAEIEATLQRLLTHDMIPRQYLIVNHIPKTASKKTDRKKLHAQAEKYWTRHLLDQGIQDKTSTTMAKSPTLMVKML